MNGRGRRTSPLTGSPRSAANPANALLKYLYVILAAKARSTLVAVGLDPGLGVLHADLKARDSLALDLMEAARPQVDSYVLRLLRTHTFAARDFFETRQGACRVLPPLTHWLAETAPTLAIAVAPIAERVARDLFRPEGRAAKRDRLAPSPLTQGNRSSGREANRLRGKLSAPSIARVLPARCAEYGEALGNPSRTHCEDCLPRRRKEAAAIFVSAGPRAVAVLRAEGVDPAHGGEAARKRGRRNAEHASNASIWEGSAGLEDQDFTRDVLPRLQSVPLRAMAEATGRSEGSCSFVQRGLKVPHRRRRRTLARLTDLVHR